MSNLPSETSDADRRSPIARISNSLPRTGSSLELDRLHTGDCLELFSKVADGTVDLIFADPPFNIGYDYDIYDDSRDAEAYLEWTLAWGREVARVLRPSGTFWLAIGDEFAAELKVLFHRELGFSLRSWVIWYYTFGVHCTRKFARSHAHLFYFVKDPKQSGRPAAG
jgi:DNA modification methylase